jgi:hypothetical protein
MPLRPQTTAVTVAQAKGGRWSWIRTGALLALALAAVVVLAAGCERRGAAPPAKVLPAMAPTGRLQEVSAPGAVAEIEAALASHRPRVRITSPAEGALLPAGPWQLGLVLDDWPLVQDPSLGLGPHLVVQVDDGPGQRISDWSQGDVDSGRLDLAMGELAPGSHRISVYAALPWGEAVKRPGASDQRLVHRVAANPLSQPPAGSAKLLAVSPDGLSRSEPVLIDWLLRDAPLQGLREGDGRWRLRISVNGDSFLVDQNSPLWLRGLKPGGNAVLLELLDGLGEPLNPPFNSLVREVVIQPGANLPVWLNERITPAELSRLLGDAPPQESPIRNSPEAAAGSEAAPGPETAQPQADQHLASPAEPSPAEPSPPDNNLTAVSPGPGAPPADPEVAPSAISDPEPAPEPAASAPTAAAAQPEALAEAGPDPQQSPSPEPIQTARLRP